MHGTIGTGFAAILVLAANAQDAAPPGRTGAGETGAPAIVVGTFDSRAVAIAHVRSEGFSAYLRAQQEDVLRASERAREAGDDELAGALDELGPAMQQRIHAQGFGNAPVDDVLARIADDLPAIAREAGVDVIVSKWELDWVGPKARFVDVTDRLVARFDPSADTWKAVHEIVEQDPVPLDRLHHDH